MFTILVMDCTKTLKSYFSWDIFICPHIHCFVFPSSSSWHPLLEMMIYLQGHEYLQMMGELCLVIGLDGFLKNVYRHWHSLVFVCQWGVIGWSSYREINIYKRLFGRPFEMKNRMAWYFSYVPLNCHMSKIIPGQIRFAYIIGLVHWHSSFFCYMNLLIMLNGQMLNWFWNYNLIVDIFQAYYL